MAAGSPRHCSVCSDRSTQTSLWYAGVPDAMAGADACGRDDALHDALEGAIGVVLALALTPETEGIIGAAELALMSAGWLVNVARGKHIVTDELVEALHNGVIGGAGARRHRSRAVAGRPSAVVDTELHHHAARCQHARDGIAAPRRRVSPTTSAGGGAASRSSVWSTRPLATDAAGLAGLLADARRRRVFAALVLGDRTIEQVRESTGMTRARSRRRWRDSSTANWSWPAATTCTSSSRKRSRLRPARPPAHRA